MPEVQHEALDPRHLDQEEREADRDEVETASPEPRSPGPNPPAERERREEQHGCEHPDDSEQLPEEHDRLLVHRETGDEIAIVPTEHGNRLEEERAIVLGW